MPSINYLDREDPDFLPRDEDPSFDGSSFQQPKKQEQVSSPGPGGLQSAIDRRTTVIGQRPKQPEPKWWQRALAGAAGGAAGLVNAGGRVRPIDAGPLTEEIMAPGHRRRLADWGAQVEEAEVGIQGEQQKLAAEQQAQRMSSEGDLRRSQMKVADAQLARANRPDQPPRDPGHWVENAQGEVQWLPTPTGGEVQKFPGVGKGVAPPRPEKDPGHWTTDDKGAVRWLPTPKGGEPAVFPGAGKARPAAASAGSAGARGPQGPAGSRAASGSPQDARLVQTVMSNPALWNRLTPTVQTRIAPLLDEAGFTGFGNSAKPSTTYQMQTGGYYMRLQDAEKTFAGLEGHISKMGLVGQAYYDKAPYVIQSSENKVLQNAQRQFTEARLRKESGAAIPPHEYENDKKMYFPRFGDDVATLKQKKQARQALMKTFKVQAGPKVMEEMIGEVDGPIQQGTSSAPAPAPVPKTAEEYLKSIKR